MFVGAGASAEELAFKCLDMLARPRSGVVDRIGERAVGSSKPGLAVHVKAGHLLLAEGAGAIGGWDLWFGLRPGAVRRCGCVGA